MGLVGKYCTEMWCGNEAGSYMRRIDSCITQHKAQAPSRTCNERKEKKKKKGGHTAGGYFSVPAGPGLF